MHRNRFSAMLFLAVLTLGLAACCGSLDLPVRPTDTPEPTRTPRPTSVPFPTQPPSLPPANALEGQIEAIYREYGPSVVNITSRVISYDFFMQPFPQEGTGSGFVYDREGHIVTNYHVVENADEVIVAFESGATYPAQVIGEDPSTDLAVLQVDADDLPQALTIGDSDRLRVGQFAVAIGNPFGLERTLTLGVISALERVIESPNGRFIGEAIQTDAAINPGNSGGPMLNLNGEVIGVNSQIISPSGASAGIGFAIPSNTVQRIVTQLIARGSYPHPWLGVNLVGLSQDVIALFEEAGMDITVDEGLMVLEVVQGSPADRAGLRGAQQVVRINRTQVPIGGDILIAVDGQPMKAAQDLTLYLEAERLVGETVRLSIVRDGREMQINATLAERPAQ